MSYDYNIRNWLAGLFAAVGASAAEIQTQLNYVFAWYGDHTTISAAGPTNDVDVTNINTLYVDNSSNAVVIGGFKGGVKGQPLRVIRTSTAFAVTLEHNEGSGNQDILVASSADSASKRLGGWDLSFNGTNWVEVSKSLTRVRLAIDMAGADFSQGNQGPDHAKIGNYSAWTYDIGDDSVITFEIPHDWEPGTDMDVKVDWGCAEAFATRSGECQWNISWTATPHDASRALDAASTTLDPGDLNIPAISKALTRTVMGVIAGSSLSEEDEMGFKIERVALDGGVNPVADPFITHFYIEYWSDRRGEN